jgi:hypothetical protein
VDLVQGHQTCILYLVAGAWAEDLRSLLAQMISAKKLKVALGYEDFVTFNRYYRAVRAGDIQTADQLAGARDKI